MIYLDNAATSWPKPLCVQRAMGTSLTQYGANPGRSGYAMGLHTAERVYRARETAARLFGVPTPNNVVFTANCTTALNMAIRGLAHRGKRIVVSSMEHNAVMRPVHWLQQQGMEVAVATVVPENDEATVAAFARLLTRDTAMVICTHASNVTGEVLPIRAIGALAKERHIPFIVDAAQSAGMLPLNMQEDAIDFLCIAGHKGVYGPMGTGLLCSSGKYTLTPLLCGGTGSHSASLAQPDEWPEAMESGTVNVVGIIALDAGMRWIEQSGVDNLHTRETTLVKRLYDGLIPQPHIIVYGTAPTPYRHVPLLSINIRGIPSEEVAATLGDHGVAVRAGLHCAPSAHRQIGTLSHGTVRLALSAFTTTDEVDRVCKFLATFRKKSLQIQKNMIQ